MVIFLNDDGVAHVVKAGPTYELFPAMSSAKKYGCLVISGGQIFLRGFKICTALALPSNRARNPRRRHVLPTVSNLCRTRSKNTRSWTPLSWLNVPKIILASSRIVLIYLHGRRRTRVLQRTSRDTGNVFAGSYGHYGGDRTTQRWWSFCEPCQKPLQHRGALG